MSRPPRAATTRALLTLPGVRRAVAASTLARLSYATGPLALLLTIHRTTGSYAAAGIAVGGYGLAALGMPIKARWVDRRGARTVLPPLGLGFAASLGSIAVVRGPVPVVVGLAALAGLAAPPVGPTMRALWASLTPEPALRVRAYAFDTILEDTLFAGGPLVVGALALLDVRVALVLAAAANVVGVSALPGTDPGGRPEPQGRSLLGPWRVRGFPVLALLLAAMGLGTGPLEVAVVARAGQLGHPATAGFLVGAMSVGSAVGGVIWARRTHRRAASKQLAGLFAVLALGTAAAAAAPEVGGLLASLLVAGSASAPALIVGYVAADALVPAAERTEATTWLSTASNAGVSAGAAASGLLVDRIGPSAVLALAATVLAATALAALGCRRLR